MDASATILTRLRTQLSSLPALLGGVHRSAYDARVGDKWSVTENVAHLARYHEVTIERVQLILTEHEPTIASYRAETDPEWPEWHGLSFEEAVLRLHAARGTLIGILESLEPAQWTRVGHHAGFGALSVRAWLELFLAHEGHHLYVITKRARGME
ncbi:MAG TPA: DinB family protein [Vicinamibacterales bacterium]|jgi:hypothetical protein|nr:DinB family protein [Vicinamibacterales bacterium]